MEIGLSQNPEGIDPVERSFKGLMSAVRKGDITSVQYCLTLASVDVNAVDEFDYSPLILVNRHSQAAWGQASICGHYEIVEFLLESGARCERDTFQGERAIYGALNDRIRNLLIKHDYSVSVDARQPFAALISSLLAREAGVSSIPGIFLPRPSGDTYLRSTDSQSNDILAHAFVLAARSPYFKELISQKIHRQNVLEIPPEIPFPILKRFLGYIYMLDMEDSVVDGELMDIGSINGVSVLRPDQYKFLTSGNRTKRSIMIEAAQRDFMRLWDDHLCQPLRLSLDDATNFSVDMLSNDVKALRPDIVLRVEPQGSPFAYFYGVHKSVLQSDYINTAIRFKQRFQPSECPEGQPVAVSIEVTCEIIEAILKWSYTDILELEPELGLDLLLAADMLLIERLKSRTCLLIATQDRDELLTGDLGFSIFDIARAGWQTRTSAKLDPFCAKFLATRLELCLDPDSPIGAQFSELVKESAGRIGKREATDTIEIIDDIRYYLDERFRMRFDDISAIILENDGDSIPSTDRDLLDPSTEFEALRTNSNKFNKLTGDIDVLLEKLGLDA